MIHNNRTDTRRRFNREMIWRIAISLLYITAAVSALIYTKGKLRYFDEFQFLSLAKNLATRGIFSLDGTHLTAYRAPGWPAVMAAMWRIWPSVIFIKIFNLACWMLTGLLVSRLAKMHWGTGAGRLAALWYLSYLVELYTATTLYPETLAALLTAYIFVVATDDGAHDLVKQAKIATLSAVQLLAIPNCIVVTVAVYSYMLITKKITLRGAVVAALVVLAVVGLWCFRNDQATGKFTFGTNMGINLLYGNNSNATAAGGVRTDITKYTDENPRLSEVEADEFFKEAAIRWISRHPRSAFRLFEEKLVYWFAYKNSYETRDSSRLLSVLSGAMFIIYYPMLIAAAIALFSERRPVRGIVVLAWTLNLLAALSYAVFFTRLRFRLPFDPPLFSVAAGAVMELGRRYLPSYGRTQVE